MKKILEEKKLLRKSLRHSRDSMSDRSEKDKQILNHLLANSNYQSATRIMVYLAIQSEVGTKEFIESAWKSGKELYAPYVSGEQLKIANIKTYEDLEEGAFSVLEPVQALRSAEDQVFVSELELVLVPALGFDRSGYRIGYGKGFYDRFFSRLTPGTIKIGLAYESQVLERLPVEPHDCQVDMIITENSIITVG